MPKAVAPIDCCVPLYTDVKKKPSRYHTFHAIFFLVGSHTHTHTHTRRPAARTTIQIGSLPREMQELVVVDDLLSVLIGIEGKYITILPTVGGGVGNGNHGGAGAAHERGNLGEVSDASGFECDAGMDASLAELVGRVLPVCAAYSTIACFTDGRTGYAQGSVRQALCAAMRALLKEYLIVVAQLETQYLRGNMSVQKLLLYVQPCMRTMTVLAEIAQDIHRGQLSGGSLLSYVHEKAMSSIGDIRTQELMLHMVSCCLWANHHTEAELQPLLVLRSLLSRTLPGISSYNARLAGNDAVLALPALPF